MFLRYWLASVVVLVTAGCSAERTGIPNVAEPPAFPEPVRPQLKIDVEQIRSDVATLRVEFPETWVFGARVKWFRNGVTYSSGTTDNTYGRLSTEVTTAMPPDMNPDPFAEEGVTETWAVEVTPRHWLGKGDLLTAQTEIRLTRGCEVFHPGWVYVGCRRDAVFSVPLTQPVDLGATSPALYLAQVVEEHFLGRPGTPGHDRLRAFIHLMALSAAETTDVTLLPHDPETYLVNHDVVLSPEKRLVFDRTCLDIPLVGSICLHAFVTDVNNEPGDLFLDFGPEAEAATLAPPEGTGSGLVLLSGPAAAAISYATAASYGSYDIRPLGDRRYEVALRLHGATFDLLFEPPTDPELIDIKNQADVGYDPAYDLSSYVKAYGHARVGTPYEARFEVTVPHATFSDLDFTLVSVSLLQPAFQYVFHKGPYCNSNLGTTETPAAGPRHSADPARRPFDSSGTPMFAGLISDTVSGAQGGGYDDVRRTFYSKMTFSYPHEQSNEHGGSGAGRDRLGVNTGPYEFDPEAGRFSDNPNNCVRPADACDDSGSLQDGGPEWLGNTNPSSCELPNVSNNSDDATYKISEQITSIIPYLQGELKWWREPGARRLP